MTTLATKRGFFAVFLGEPLELVKAQPHQAFISAASIAFMGYFASESGVLNPVVGYLLAIGVEWAYFRGLASDSKAPTAWGAVLNWSAFGIVVLWGMLGVALWNKTITEASGGWFMAAAHVIPIAWLSLCSAMTHRAAMQVEARRTSEQERRAAERERRRQEEQDTIDMEMERKRKELAIWEEAQQTKMRLKMQAQNAQPKMRRDALSERTNADEKLCPKCGAELERAQWLAARRWGHCSSCKGVE